MFKVVKSFCKKVSNKVSLLIATMVVAMLPVVASAEEATLDINFSTTEMFTWAQTIINAMLPIVYITMGLGLGFLIIRSLKNAFN